MQELIDHIPFLDVTISGLIVFFIYIGWKHGLPRLLMAVGSVYTGFLLASIYYHLFARVIKDAFKLEGALAPDLVSFLILDILVTMIMLGLLFSLFGHIEIKGRLIVFGKVGGTLSSVLTCLMAVTIVVTLLRIPYEANKQKLNANSDMPVIQLFNNGYERSALSPLFVSAAPLLVKSVEPMLPPEARAKKAVPLLETVVSEH